MTPENKERNIEIYYRHTKDHYSYRRLGKIYGIHYTTVQKLINRYRILERENKLEARLAKV